MPKLSTRYLYLKNQALREDLSFDDRRAAAKAFFTEYRSKKTKPDAFHRIQSKSRSYEITFFFAELLARNDHFLKAYQLLNIKTSFREAERYLEGCFLESQASQSKEIIIKNYLSDKKIVPLNKIEIEIIKTNRKEDFDLIGMLKSFHRRHMDMMLINTFIEHLISLYTP